MKLRGIFMSFVVPWPLPLSFRLRMSQGAFGNRSGLGKDLHYRKPK